MESEKGFIGAVLNSFESPEAHLRLRVSKVDWFTDNFARETIKVMKSQAEEGKSLDPLVVIDLINKPWASGYVMDCVGAVFSSANLREYSNGLQLDYARRQIVNECKDAITELDQLSIETPEKLQELEATIRELTKEAAPQEYAADLKDLVGAVYRDVTEAPDNIPTGLRDIDAALRGGPSPGQLVLLGARSGMGKTCLALNICRGSNFMNGRRILFNTLEISGKSLAHDYMQCCAITNMRLRDAAEAGNMRALSKYEHIAEKIQTNPGFSICHARTPRLLERQIQIAQAAGGIDLVVVDHVHIMESDIRGLKEYERVSNISRELKDLAVKYNVVILALCQFSRELEKRDDKKPTVSDLRGSGSLEQDADVILFLYRAHEYDPAANEKHAQVFIGKNRSTGQLGSISLTYHAAVRRFEDWEKEVTF